MHRFKLENNHRLAWAILILLSVIWGSSFILIKKSLLAFTGVEVGLTRVAISFLAFLPYVLIQIKHVDWTRWKLYLLVGLTGNGLPAILYAVAETQIDSAIAGVLNSLTPIFTLILAWIIWKQKSNVWQVLGIILGFLGTSWLLILGVDGISFDNIPYGLLIVLATFCYGISANVVQHKLSDLSPSMIGALSFLFIGPWAFVYLLFKTDFIHHLTTSEHGLFSFSMVSILAIVGTVISSIIFYRLVQLTNAVFASMVSFLIPIVALGWGILDQEALVWMHVFGIIAILMGIYLVKLRKP